MKESVSPKQAAVALGVSEASLKRWCDKGLLPATRTPGGHRRLPIFGVIQFIRQRGHALVRPEVLGLPAAVVPGEMSLSRARDLFLPALIAGDEEQAVRLAVNLYLAGHPVHELCDKLLTPTLHQLGERWSHGEAEIYQERRAVEVCIRVLHQLRMALRQPGPAAPLAIGATLEHDPYVLPCLMVEIVLIEAGWRARSYGSGHPVGTLIKAIEEARPQLFWLSVSTFADESRFIDEYRALHGVAGRVGAAVVIGGRILSQSVRDQLRYSAFCDQLGHLVAFTRTLEAMAWTNRAGGTAS